MKSSITNPNLPRSELNFSKGGRIKEKTINPRDWENSKLKEGSAQPGRGWVKRRRNRPRNRSVTELSTTAKLNQ
jgi:hypothetical protein